MFLHRSGFTPIAVSAAKTVHAPILLYQRYHLSQLVGRFPNKLQYISSYSKVC